MKSLLIEKKQKMASSLPQVDLNEVARSVIYQEIVPITLQAWHSLSPPEPHSPTPDLTASPVHPSPDPLPGAASGRHQVVVLYTIQGLDGGEPQTRCRILWLDTTERTIDQLRNRLVSDPMRDVVTPGELSVRLFDEKGNEMTPDVEAFTSSNLLLVYVILNPHNRGEVLLFNDLPGEDQCREVNVIVKPLRGKSKKFGPIFLAPSIPNTDLLRSYVKIFQTISGLHGSYKILVSSSRVTPPQSYRLAHLPPDHLQYTTNIGEITLMEKPEDFLLRIWAAHSSKPEQDHPRAISLSGVTPEKFAQFIPQDLVKTYKFGLFSLASAEDTATKTWEDAEGKIEGAAGAFIVLQQPDQQEEWKKFAEWFNELFKIHKNYVEVKVYLNGTSREIGTQFLPVYIQSPWQILSLLKFSFQTGNISLEASQVEVKWSSRTLFKPSSFKPLLETEGLGYPLQTKNLEAINIKLDPHHPAIPHDMFYTKALFNFAKTQWPSAFNWLRPGPGPITTSRAGEGEEGGGDRGAAEPLVEVEEGGGDRGAGTHAGGDRGAGTHAGEGGDGPSSQVISWHVDDILICAVPPGKMVLSNPSDFLGKVAQLQSQILEMCQLDVLPEWEARGVTSGGEEVSTSNPDQVFDLLRGGSVNQVIFRPPPTDLYVPFHYTITGSGIPIKAVRYFPFPPGIKQFTEFYTWMSQHTKEQFSFTVSNLRVDGQTHGTLTSAPRHPQVQVQPYTTIEIKAHLGRLRRQVGGAVAKWKSFFRDTEAFGQGEITEGEHTVKVPVYIGEEREPKAILVIPVNGDGDTSSSQIYRLLASKGFAQYNASIWMDNLHEPIPLERTLDDPIPVGVIDTIQLTLPYTVDSSIAPSITPSTAPSEDVHLAMNIPVLWQQHESEEPALLAMVQSETHSELASTVILYELSNDVNIHSREGEFQTRLMGPKGEVVEQGKDRFWSTMLSTGWTILVGASQVAVGLIIKGSSNIKMTYHLGSKLSSTKLLEFAAGILGHMGIHRFDAALVSKDGEKVTLHPEASDDQPLAGHTAAWLVITPRSE